MKTKPPPLAEAVAFTVSFAEEAAAFFAVFCAVSFTAFFLASAVTAFAVSAAA